MIFVYILIAALASGSALGLLLFFGILVWEGRLTLPGTRARKLSNAQLQVDLLSFEQEKVLKQLEINHAKFLENKQLDAMIAGQDLPVIPRSEPRKRLARGEIV